MKCYVHEETKAIGVCVGCGKFICLACNVEIKGKNYCKKCIAEILEEDLFAEAVQTDEIRVAPPYPRNNVLIHILLILLSGGIGNIFYFLYVKNKQESWESKYRVK